MDNLQDLPNEIWKRIPGYSLYEISNMGRIKTFNHMNKVKTAILKPGQDRGYNKTMLKRDSDGKIHTIKYHRLVGITFIPNPENKPYINHKNGIRNDNRVCNLEWVTAKENVKHAFDVGLHSHKGERNTATKLTDKQALEIRNKFTYGRNGKPKKGDITRKMLAEEYGVGIHVIKRIVGNNGWKHLPHPNYNKTNSESVTQVKKY